MSEIKEQAQGFVERVKSKFNKEIDLISKKTGYDGKLIASILGVCAILTFINLFGRYITCLVGVVLPSYWSIKAIESQEYGDEKQWLTYWAIYGIFTLLDHFANFILRIFPFYFVIKIFFLIWCFMPNTQGALMVYNHIIKKFFIKYENNLDQLVNKVMKRSQETTQRVREEIEKNKDKIASAGISAASAVNDALKTD